MEKITFAGQIFQYLITGLTIGSIYAMVAVGFNIIYNVTEIINFAQGEFVMLGGLVMVFFCVTLKLPLILAFSATVILVTLVGILLDRLAISPIRQPTVLTLIIATIAASIADEDANIQNVSIEERDGMTSCMHFVIEVRDRRHLACIMKRLRKNTAVTRISRERH